MGIINTELREVGVRQVMIWGYKVFPTAKRNWPTVRFAPKTPEEADAVISWCFEQFGYDDWHRGGPRDQWYFTYQNDATLFRLTWTHTEQS